MRNALGVALLSIVVGVGAVACGGGDGGDAGPIERGLRGLPLAAYDEAHDESGGAVQIEIADIAAISELRNLDAPEPGRDAEDVQDGLFELSVPPRDRVEVDLLGTGEPSLVQTPLGAFDDELGLDVGAITSSASITAPPIVFTVFTGELSLASSLEDIGGGVRTTRDDEDYAFDAEAFRGVDRLGRPVRAAEVDGDVAISLTEDLVADWVDDESRSLGEEDELLRVAQELDKVGVVSALIVENDFSFRASPFLDPERLDAIEEQLDSAGAIEARFDVIGIGAGEIDGDVVLIAVYLFRDEQDAEESVDLIDDLWSGAELIARPGSQTDDFVDLVSVTQSNEAVVVVAQPLDVPPMRLGASLVFQQEILFVHR